MKPETLYIESPGTALTVAHNPTEKQYSGFTAAYDHFNLLLFGSKLPGCLITLQRRKGAYGYFSPERFRSSEGIGTDEIAMNPLHFINRTKEEVLSTFAHEMVHLWQQHFGKAPKSPYHNKEWAAKMKEIGLQPSTTGEPGGKETGQNCSHYIMERGPFAIAAASFLEKGFILWGDLKLDTAKAKKKAASKTKYTCPSCEVNVWAKPETHVFCGACYELDYSLLKMEAEIE